MIFCTTTATRFDETAIASVIKISPETAGYRIWGRLLGALTAMLMGIGCSGSVTDNDGNVYRTVKIGDQIWMAQNLKTTTFNDGTPIAPIRDNDEWQGLTAPGYCWYDNLKQYKKDYGALYNWHAVNSGKLAPAGWHIPSEAEWKKCIDVLGGQDAAGGKLKEATFVHWAEPNLGATNQSKFTAFPSGMRDIDGSFSAAFQAGYWWSQTAKDAAFAFYVGLRDSSAAIDCEYGDKRFGFSVRCVKD